MSSVSDPDITRGDGIYSRYAPPLEGPSRYALTLTVDASNAVLAFSHAQSVHLPDPGSSFSAYKSAQSPDYTDKNVYHPASSFEHSTAFRTEAATSLISTSSQSSSGYSSKKIHAFVDRSDVQKLYRSSLHSIETDNDFYSPSPPPGVRYPTENLEESSQSKAQVPGEEEEYGTQRYRSRFRAKISTDFEAARHHKRRRSAHDKDVSRCQK